MRLSPTIVFDFPSPSELAAHLAAQSLQQGTQTATASASAATRLQVADASAVRQLVSSAAAVALGVERVEPTAPLMASGLTSMGAVALHDALQSALGRELPPTLVFDYPSVDALVDFLCSSQPPLLGQPPDADAPAALTGPAAPSSHLQHTQRARPPVAVIAAARRVPPGSLTATTGSCWPVDGIAVTPLARWDTDALLSGVAPDAPEARWGGYLRGFEHFDGAAFGMAPAEAVSCDPQQRLVLEVACEGLTAAAALLTGGGSGAARVPPEQGVFVGLSQVELPLLLRAGGIPLSSYSATGAHLAVAAGRVSWFFGLRGPAAAVDTACSSSLVAAHLARGSLQAGETTWASAAGVNAVLVPTWTVACARAGMLTPDGRCAKLRRPPPSAACESRHRSGSLSLCCAARVPSGAKRWTRRRTGMFVRRARLTW